MKREEKIELLKQKLVEYFNKHGIDSKFTHFLVRIKELDLKEVLDRILNEIINSRQAVFIFRLIDNGPFFDFEDEKMKKKLLSALIATKDAEYIYKTLIRYQFDLDNETIEKLERALVATNSTKDILNYIQNREIFCDSFVDLIVETKNPELIYNLAINYNQLDKAINTNKLVQALIETDNMEYIKLLADRFNNFISNSQLNQKIYDYLNDCLPYVEGADKAKLMNIRNEYEPDNFEGNEDSETIEKIIDTD